MIWSPISLFRLKCPSTVVSKWEHVHHQRENVATLRLIIRFNGTMKQLIITCKTSIIFSSAYHTVQRSLPVFDADCESKPAFVEGIWGCLNHMKWLWEFFRIVRMDNFESRDGVIIFSKEPMCRWGPSTEWIDDWSTNESTIFKVFSPKHDIYPMWNKYNVLDI